MFRTFILLAFVLTVPSTGFAQPAFSAATDTDKSQPVRPTPNVGAKISRWIEPLGLSTGLLLQSEFDARGETTLAQLRGQLQTSVRFKVDRQDRLSFVAGGGTGTSIRSGWNHTALGSRPAVTRLFVKHLFVSAAPVKSVRVQVGSLPGQRGQFSEITGLDNDVYVTGARVTAAAPSRLWFDDVVVTRGYFGDAQHASVFGRMDRLSERNYLQVAATRKLKPAAFTIELLDRPSGRGIGGALVSKGVPGLSAVRVEAARTFDGSPAHAVTATGERTFRSLTVSGGVSSVTGMYAELNGDRYTPGDRVFSMNIWKPRPELMACFFVGRALGQTPEPRTRVDVVVLYDVMKRLKGRR